MPIVPIVPTRVSTTNNHQKNLSTLTETNKIVSKFENEYSQAENSHKIEEEGPNRRIERKHSQHRIEPSDKVHYDERSIMKRN